ncbi:MAG: hypothetical protein LBP89_09780 [Helicobacteraceae bacterium]|jgi:hypothetical protein|nr:hypothetical protein [Helicobacteraceae bacterium]
MRKSATPDDKRKHLKFIQDVINRLSSNTFLLKGWSITIIGAIFTATLTTGNYNLLWVILGAVLIFWFIDAYYLALERRYRNLYSRVAELSADKIDYSMKTPKLTFLAWFEAFRRPVLVMFYGVVLLIVAGFLVSNNFDISLIIKVKE